MAGGWPFWTFKTGVFCFIGMSLVSSKRGLGVFVACFFQAWIGSFRGNDGVVWGLSAPGALPEPLVGEFGVISSVYKAVFVKIGL